MTAKILSGLAGALRRFARGERAAVSITMALMVVPLVGAMAVAGEMGVVYFMQRSAQNAADSAALAAATNNCRSGCAVDYQEEAAATAAGYGFTNGANNATVASSYAACPTGAANCYYVDITKVVPVALTRIVGFQGSQALGSGRGQIVRARAVASTRVEEKYCVVTLGTGNQDFRVNGTASPGLNGCDIYSSGGVKCGGSGFGIDNASSAQSNTDNCGSVSNNGNVLLTATDANFLAKLSDLSYNNIPAPSGCKSGGLCLSKDAGRTRRPGRRR